jgi:hypothetical protein
MLLLHLLVWPLLLHCRSLFWGDCLAGSTALFGTALMLPQGRGGDAVEDADSRGDCGWLRSRGEVRARFHDNDISQQGDCMMSVVSGRNIGVLGRGVMRGLWGARGLLEGRLWMCLLQWRRAVAGERGMAGDDGLRLWRTFAPDLSPTG